MEPRLGTTALEDHMGKTYNHHTTFMYYCNLFTIVEGSGVSGQGGGEAVGGQ